VTSFLVAVLKVTDENSRADLYPNPDPYQNVTDPEHCVQEIIFPLRTVLSFVRKWNKLDADLGKYSTEDIEIVAK
jgi:hypothetical protein